MATRVVYMRPIVQKCAKSASGAPPVPYSAHSIQSYNTFCISPWKFDHEQRTNNRLRQSCPGGVETQVSSLCPTVACSVGTLLAPLFWDHLLCGRWRRKGHVPRPSRPLSQLALNLSALLTRPLLCLFFCPCPPSPVMATVLMQRNWLTVRLRTSAGFI